MSINGLGVEVVMTIDSLLLPLNDLSQLADHYCHWFLELSFSRISESTTARLHIYPLCGICYFPWHRYQIEGTTDF